MVSIALQHAGELQGGWTADAVGDQKSPDLGFVDLTCEHQLDGSTGFVAAEAGAGVFTAAHLADQLAEQGPLRTEGPKLGGPALLPGRWQRCHLWIW